MPADQAMMKALHITAEDLSYNKRGELSPRQLGEIRSTNAGCRAITGIVSLFCIVISAYALLTPLDSGGRLAVCINAGIWGGVSLMLFSTSIKPTIPTVGRAQGSAKLQIDYDDGHKYYLLILNKDDFKVPEEVYKLIEEGDEYIVYYSNTPLGKKMLSMEQASTGSASSEEAK